MLGGIGMQEILVILLIILLLFGAKRIPEMAKGMGKGIKEFKKAARDVKDQVDIDEKEETEAKPREAEGEKKLEG